MNKENIINKLLRRKMRGIKSEESKRYPLIDGIRGLAITNMVVFHFLYDVYIIYGKNSVWYALPHIHIWQQAICWTFIFVSGFVWQLGMKNNFRRGVFFNICGMTISLITWRMIPTEAIWFGILILWDAQFYSRFHSIILCVKYRRQSVSFLVL